MSKPAPLRPALLPRWKILLLQIYRLVVVCLIIFVLRQHFTQLKIQGDAPITVSELQNLLPGSSSLSLDTGPRAGVFVYNQTGEEIGYAVRTSPQSENIIGYAGPTDVLIVFGLADDAPNPASLAIPPGEKIPDPVPLQTPTRKLVGIQVRKSWDTVRHVQWVVEDAYYMQFWKGRDWENLSSLNLYDEYMEGVSGSTLSSMGMARSIQHRLRWSEEAASTPSPELRISGTDVGLWLALSVGLLVTFRSGWKGKKNIWTGLKLAALIYVGFLNGSLLAISLLSGYAIHGLPWQLAPGLVSLVAISFLIPWTTHKQPYCNHICPHGAAQQLLSRYSPWKFQISPQIANGLRWLPWFLLVIALASLILRLPLDLSYLEPFDAYLFHQSAWVPIAIAVCSLLVSAFVPMAYCKYGCPTGMLLEFARGRGRTDRFGKRDLAALVLLLLVCLLVLKFQDFNLWLSAPLRPFD